MEIGSPKRIVVVEPVEDPIRRARPAGPERDPAPPAPERERVPRREAEPART